MSWVAVAIAGSTLVSGYLGSEASSDAARASSRGSQAGIEEQRRQFDIIMGLQRPYSVAGTGALNNLARLYGLPYAPYQDPPMASGVSRVGGGGSGSNALGGLLGSAAGFGLGGIGGSLIGGALGLGGKDRPPGVFSAKGVMSLIKQGYSVEDINKLGYLNNELGQKQIRRLQKAGISAEDIDRLKRGVGSPLGTGEDPRAEIVTPSGPDMSVFTTSPDYQFRRDEGMRDIGNSFAARGGAFSGNALRSLNDFNSNLASSEFGNYFNRMAALAGIGQTAANAGSQAAMNTGNNVAGLLQNQGNARASGILGRANSVGGALNSGLNNWLLYRGGYFG